MAVFGMVIAVEDELGGVLKAFGKEEEFIDDAFPVYKITRNGAVIYVASSGAGEIAAAAATQLLISKFGAETILNFGFVGALKPNYVCQQLLFVKDVVHYDFDTSLIDNVRVGRYKQFPSEYISFDGRLIKTAQNIHPEIPSVRLASGDKFIAKKEKKDGLVKDYDADICDMEGAAIALTCLRNDVPALSVKVVSDNADEKSPTSFGEIAKRGTEDCAKILTTLIDELVKETKNAK